MANVEILSTLAAGLGAGILVVWIVFSLAKYFLRGGWALWGISLVGFVWGVLAMAIVPFLVLRPLAEIGNSYIKPWSIQVMLAVSIIALPFFSRKFGRKGKGH